jgi:hypothetical protein
MVNRITTYNFLILCIFCIGSLLVSCDNTEITSEQADTFVKYNGIEGDIIGYDVTQGVSGNYYITGSVTTMNNETDLFLLITDIYGNQIGALHNYGGMGSEFGKSIQVAEDGSIYIAGSYFQTSPSDNTDVYLLKLNTDGDTLWTKTFGGNSDDQATSLLVDTDGNLVIAGITESFGNGGKDGLLIKTDTDGNLIEAMKTFGFENDDELQSVIQYDGGYYCLGSTYNYQQSNANSLFIIKTNIHGTAVDYGVIGSTSGDLTGKEISETDNGDLVLAGTLDYTVNSNSSTYITRIHPDLFTKEWETVLQDEQSICNDMLILNEDILLLSTLSWGTDDHSSIIINRVGMEGASLEKISLGIGSGHLKAMSFNTALNGGLIIVGSNKIAEDEVVSLLKVNSNFRLY